jgi:hypothetical protein
LGVVLAFRHQARKICKFSKQTITKGPNRFRSLKKEARHSAIAMAFKFAVVTKRVRGIEPQHPAQLLVDNPQVCGNTI